MFDLCAVSISRFVYTELKRQIIVWNRSWPDQSRHRKNEAKMPKKTVNILPPIGIFGNYAEFLWEISPEFALL